MLQSFLECHNGNSSSTGRFHGNLDIKTLGGAGFASQRTTGEDRCWDLSAFAGIVLDIAEADGKSFLFPYIMPPPPPFHLKCESGKNKIQNKQAMTQ
jgi:hypothetical protein